MSVAAKLCNYMFVNWLKGRTIQRCKAGWFAAKMLSSADKLLSITYKVLTTTQFPYLHNLISVQRPRSTRSSWLCRYSCSANIIILSKNNWSLLPLCFTLSVESTPFISSSTSFWYQFLHFRRAFSFTHNFFLFWFTSLFIHNSFSLSLPA